MDRVYSAQIAYPLISQDPVADYGAYLDALLYVSPTDPDEGVGAFTNDGDISVWLILRSQEALPSTLGTVEFLVKVPADPDYLDTSVDTEFTDFVYIKRTFTFDTAIKTIQTIIGDDGRSALILNVGAIYTIAPNTGDAYVDAVIEPGCVVPCRRRVNTISLYNEYRAKDPTDRDSLPPDSQQEGYTEGQDIILNDGYNCALDYDENSNILRITGGVGLGTGQPDSNEWDDEVGSELRGIRTINGVNQNGVVDIESGSSVLIKGTVGDLEIFVRDQGDIE